MKRMFYAKMILKVLVFVPLLILGVGYITMYLWNWLVPELFNGPVITFCQALGLLILSKIFFSGFKGRGGRCCCHHGHGSWKEKMKEKWENLSEEERKNLKNRFFSKCYKDDKKGSDSETKNV